MRPEARRMGAAVAAALVLDGILFALAGLGLRGAEGGGRNGAGPELPPLLVVLSPPAPQTAEPVGTGPARAISGRPASGASEAEARPPAEEEAGVPSADGAAEPTAGAAADPGAEAPAVSPDFAGSPVPTSPASMAADAAEGEARLRARIDALVRDRLVYPAAARRRNTEGTVTVVLRISPAGTLDSLELAESSGSPVLDRAALSLFSRIFPLDPPLPVTAGSVSLRVQVAYILR